MKSLVFLGLSVIVTYNLTAQQKLVSDCRHELPIKPHRTIAFTTNEASYIDVDISPDSKTILFSFLGNIYTLSASGGTAKQLTRGLAINRCPVWSPNGRLIAYESDASGLIKLHVVDSSGRFHKVLGDNNI
jgi:Tol biopolymer transport system component